MKHAKCVGKTRVLVQTKMHMCSLCKPKCISEVHANHDAHGSRLTSRVYTHALNMNFTSLIFRAHTGYVASIFRNVLSRVVASLVCSHV